MMKYAIAFAAAGALALTGAYAQGQMGGGPNKAQMMSKMNAKVESHFKAMDVNGDGVVSEQEFIDFVTAKAKAKFTTAAGEDHVMSLDEMKAMHKAQHQQKMEQRGKMMKKGAPAATPAPADDKDASDQQ